jgi:hypothetical protein
LGAAPPRAKKSGLTGYLSGNCINRIRKIKKNACSLVTFLSEKHILSILLTGFVLGALRFLGSLIACVSSGKKLRPVPLSGSQ